MKLHTHLHVENLEKTLNNSDTYVKDMLKFYENGWEERGADDKQQFETRIKANVVNTLTYTSEVLNMLVDLKIQPKAAHIKLENPSSQSVIIVVSLQDFMSEDLLKVYKTTHKIEKNSRSGNYRVSFILTYDDGTLDADCMLSDGYVKTFGFE